MKTFAKILSIVLCLTMVIGMFAVIANAAEGASISFADTANRTSISEEEQVWSQNGITVTNQKAESASPVADYSNPARFYKGSSLTVAYAGMKQINFNCNSDKYAGSCLESITGDANATATANGKVVTVVFTNAVDSFTISSLAAQVRVDSIDVYTTVNDTEPEPEPDPVKVSIVDAIKIAQEGNGNMYIVSGTITKIDNETYGNLYIADDNGNELYVYGLYSADGSVRYDAMEVKPVAGDKVELLGELTTYKGNSQMKNAWLKAHTPGEGTPDPEPEPEPVEAQLPDVTAPAANTAYKFGMIQVKNGHTVYINGGIDQDRYLTTTENKADAVDVYVVAEGDGFKFYFEQAGAHNYITLGLNEAGKVALSYGDVGTVWKYDASIFAWCAELDGTMYYMGSYNNFDTISASKTSYINAENAGVSQFPAGFFAAEAGTDPNPDEPAPGGDAISLAICSLLVSGGALAILPKKREN